MTHLFYIFLGLFTDSADLIFPGLFDMLEITPLIGVIGHAVKDIHAHFTHYPGDIHHMIRVDPRNNNAVYFYNNTLFLECPYCSKLIFKDDRCSFLRPNGSFPISNPAVDFCSYFRIDSINSYAYVADIKSYNIIYIWKNI